MTYWPHDRTYDHSGTEDCATVFLSSTVGRYAAGTLLCDVIFDLEARLEQVESDYEHGFVVFGLDAFLAPYDPGTLGGSMLGVFGLDSAIQADTTDTFGLDAAIVSPTPVEQTADFGLSAYIHDAGGIVGQIDGDIDADDTIIIVPDFANFPSECPFLVQIDGEMMLVVSGCGTDTWTVIRGYNGTTATSHSSGSVIAAC